MTSTKRYDSLITAVEAISKMVLENMIDSMKDAHKAGDDKASLPLVMLCRDQLGEDFEALLLDLGLKLAR